MTYKVIHAFMDVEDENHVYQVGDVYPREGEYYPTKKRRSELSSDKNKIGTPLIEIVEEEEQEQKPKAKKPVKAEN